MEILVGTTYKFITGLKLKNQSRSLCLGKALDLHGLYQNRIGPTCDETERGQFTITKVQLINIPQNVGSQYKKSN
jgi:hypothetical protein